MEYCEQHELSVHMLIIRRKISIFKNMQFVGGFQLMQLKAIKTCLKIISTILIVWLVIALVVSTFACLTNRKISDSALETLGETQYYGDGSTGPDRALVVETPTDALNVRLELVRTADETLDIVYYKIGDSESARAFLGEVLSAADRGVSVRILVDGTIYATSGDSKDYLRALDSHENIECRKYNPLDPLRPARWHSIMHDKFIIVDSELLLLGGRNINERHFDPSDYDYAIANDRDVLVWHSGESSEDKPSATAQTGEYMNMLWDYELSKSLSSSQMKADKAGQYWQDMRNATESLKISQPQFYVRSMQDYLNDTVETSRITLIHNPIDADTRQPWIATQLAGLMGTAEQYVMIQTPYSVGNKALIADLTEIADKTELIYITNSSASTPNITAFSNYYGHRQKFVDSGAHVFEYQSSDSIHGKSILIDGRISVIGSFNMDDRSFYLDTETMLVIDSPALAEQLGDAMGDIINTSLQVSEENDYIESDSVQQMKTTAGKNAILKVVYFLLRPFQFLL